MAAPKTVNHTALDCESVLQATIVALDRFAVWRDDDIQGLRYHAMREAQTLRAILAHERTERHQPGEPRVCLDCGRRIDDDPDTDCRCPNIDEDYDDED